MISVDSACAATWAKVTAERADVYSDVQMSSVIGYIKRGKKIRVGEVPKNKGRLLPIVVSNKVAYIQVKDIETGVEVRTLKSVSERMRENMDKKTSVKRIAAYTGTYVGLLSGNDFEDTLGDDIFFLDFGLKGYYKNLETKKQIKVTVGELISNKGNSKITLFHFNVAYNLKEFETAKYDVNFYLGGIISPYAEYKQGDDFTINGQALGSDLGAEIRFPISKQLSLHIEGNYQLLKFFNMDLPDNGLYPDSFSPWVNGVKILGTVSYEY